MLRRIIVVMVLFLTITILINAGGNNGEKEIILSLTGDILLDRGVKTHIEREGINYPYEKIKGMMIVKSNSYEHKMKILGTLELC